MGLLEEDHIASNTRDRRLLIHCNAGGRYGMGHLMRSLALAAMAREHGWQVRVVGDFDSRARAVLKGMEVTLVPVAMAPVRVEEEIGGWAPDVVHLDTYWFDAPRPQGAFLLSSMQDGGFGVREADLAVDANLGAESRSLEPLSEHYLLGTDAVVVREQVLRQRDVPVAAGKTRVLVVIGGTDPGGATESVVSAVGAITRPLRITVVLPGGRGVGLTSEASGPHTITSLDFVEDLPALAREHHLVITASGTSVWDFACMGVPMALLCVADNQRPGYQAMLDREAAFGLGELGDATMPERFRMLGDVLGDPVALAAYADRGRELVDGLGAWRIVSAWEQLLEVPCRRSHAAVTGRRAGSDDAQVLFEWRNDALTRAASRNTGAVSWGDHMAWLKRSLSREDRVLLVATDHSDPIGTVRWDHICGHDWEVSITLAPEARGRGLAGALLAFGEQMLDVPAPVRMFATVREENQASRRLFERAGYLPHLPVDDEGWCVYARWRTA